MLYIKDALYKPIDHFKPLARIFHSLSLGNATELSALKQSSRHIFCRSPLCENKPYTEPCYDTASSDFRREISAAILCSDAPATLQSWTAADHFAKWQALRAQSSSFGDYWTEITMSCASWHLRPVYNFTNPIISAENTSFPVLFVSNTRDPVTPLVNAQKMRSVFGGSGLLVQEGDGHCSISAPGTCVAERIRRYFQEGKLPEEGLVCQVDRTPFEDAEVVVEMSDEKRKLYDAVVELGKELGRGRGSPLI
jgi:hypothetical protein